MKPGTFVPFVFLLSMGSAISVGCLAVVRHPQDVAFERDAFSEQDSSAPKQVVAIEAAHSDGITTPGCAQPDAAAGIAACIQFSGGDAATTEACVATCTRTWLDYRDRDIRQKVTDAVNAVVEQCVRAVLAGTAGTRSTACTDGGLSALDQVRCQTGCQASVSDRLRRVHE
jgi:hypothetical protein